MDIGKKIRSLTQSIRNYSENDLCYGTLKTLSMIDELTYDIENSTTEIYSHIDQEHNAIVNRDYKNGN